MELRVCHQTQRDRDAELAEYMQVSVSDVERAGVATPDAIRISTGREEVLTDGKLDAEKVTALYSDLSHLDVLSYFKTLMFTSMTRRPAALFKFVGRARATDTILDYGCGVGSHALLAAECGASVTLVDVAGPMLTFAEWRVRRRGMSNCEVLPHVKVLTQDHYTRIVCIEVLEHVVNPTNTLKQLIAASKAGGNLFVMASHHQKDSSGHFAESVNEWVREASAILDERCVHVQGHEYIKR
jgi:2-polyprenyl-3-methyl-5-hydroxy-6-metoxy-1,4-benzoquinol methylase